MDQLEEFVTRILNHIPLQACTIKNGAITFRNSLFSCSINEQDLLALVHSRDEAEYECNFISNGKMFSLRRIPLEPTFSIVFLDHMAGAQLITDPLTGVLHRECFLRVAHELLETAKRQNGILSFLFVDLDGFKSVNDTWGHDNGDLVLKAAADRICKVIRDKDFCFRLGGDEFLIVLTEIKDRMHSCLVARRLIAAVSQPIPIAGGNQATVGSSIGIASHPHDGASIEVLVSKADEAMYRAKKLGKNNYQLYHEMSGA